MFAVVGWFVLSEMSVHAEMFVFFNLPESMLPSCFTLFTFQVGEYR